MTYFISLRVRREYFEQIIDGRKDVEIRRMSPFWVRRLEKFANNGPRTLNDVVAVFVCGNRTHRRVVKAVTVDDPRAVLGRELSDQGKRDVPTTRAYTIWLGEVWAP